MIIKGQELNSICFEFGKLAFFTNGKKYTMNEKELLRLITLHNFKAIKQRCNYKLELIDEDEKYESRNK